jgi:dTDP-4-amino-4,6-dideoxygalactose transaminase
MNGQKINKKYLNQLMEFFEVHSLEDFQVIYDNEQHFKDFLNVKTFKFTNSGTSALYLILNYIKQTEGLGDELKVVGPAFSHVSWINCCEFLNIQYDFLDVKEDTLSLDPNELQKMIDDDKCPDVVVMIDMGGYIGEDTLKVKHICDENNITLVEDAAHAFGQSYKGYKSGTIGDFGFFSFSNPKLLTCGEGGAIVNTYHDLDMRFEEMIYQGGWYRYNKTKRTKGLNFIMSNWMTELLKNQLMDINEIQKEYHQKFTEYISKTPDIIQFPDSDNEFYAPSFFARKMKTVPDLIKNDFLKDLLWGRYRNMGDPNFEVSQYLEDHLVYWKL